MLLEKNEDFFELFVKQFVTESSPISLGQIVWCVESQTLMLLVAKLARYFSCQTRVMYFHVLSCSV